jgi:hypothetical protein
VRTINLDDSQSSWLGQCIPLHLKVYLADVKMVQPPTRKGAVAAPDTLTIALKYAGQ